jgi:ribosomal protein S18 acetylase RimI-like enzyme
VTAPTILILDSLVDADADAIARLLPQLSRTAVFDRDRIDAIIEHDATDLFVASINGEIVGMATLVTFPLPTGLRGHVEDVVVDVDNRGLGIARLLLEAMTEAARDRKLRTLDLTSRPARESALRLYESVGFEPRDTNVLRYIAPETKR